MVLNCYSERLFLHIYSELLLFFTFILVKYCILYIVKCKMLRYIVKKYREYRDF